MNNKLRNITLSIMLMCASIAYAGNCSQDAIEEDYAGALMARDARVRDTAATVAVMNQANSGIKRATSSCLNGLMSVRLVFNFGLPSIEDVAAAIVSASCNYVVNRVNSAVSTVANGINGVIGGAVGTNILGLPAGASVGVTTTPAGTGGVTMNGASVPIDGNAPGNPCYGNPFCGLITGSPNNTSGTVTQPTTTAQPAQPGVTIDGKAATSPQKVAPKQEPKSIFDFLR